MVAKTFAGLEGVLADELRSIGAENIEILRRAVSFTGDDEILYKANYLCRTALRILTLIDTFKIKNEEDLYNRIAKTNWSKYMDRDNTFAIDAVVFNSCITHTKYAALKMKDAIVDQFRRKYNSRPDVDTKRPDFRLSIHIENDNCLLYVDSSGSSLNKRGYRVASTEAPINEVLAAGLIQLSGWDGKTNFVDPMCGSGTILIEAAMVASNIPAGYYRKYFSFISWKNFNAEVWKKVVSESEGEIIEPEGDIIGSDVSMQSIEVAKQNVKNAKLHHDIILKQVSIQDSSAPEGGGILITNPPYDERLELKDATKLYQEIGDALKTSYKGFNTWLITSNSEALKFVGLATDKRIPLFNGALECTFAKYDIYEGTKRTPRRDADFKPREPRESQEANEQKPRRDDKTPRRDDQKMELRKIEYKNKREEKSFNPKDRRESRPFKKDFKKPEEARRDDGGRFKPFKRGERQRREEFRSGSNREDRRDDKPFNRRGEGRNERRPDRDSNSGEKRFDRNRSSKDSYKREDGTSKPRHRRS